MTKFQAILIRFCKGFIGSAIPTMVAALSGINQFNNLSELKAFAITIAIPLATGALLAFEKAINWVEPTQPVEIEKAKKTTKKKSS